MTGIRDLWCIGLLALAASFAAARPAAAVDPVPLTWAWGWDGAGQIGDGSVNNQPHVPISPTSLPVTAVAASRSDLKFWYSGFQHDHSLILLTDGTVYGFGSNTSGEMGTACPGPQQPCTSPIQIAGLSNATAISAGTAHNLALLADGTVVAWGSNYTCQLGSNPPDTEVPTPVTGLSNVTAISAGDQVSLALLVDGTVMAWGSDAYGARGDGPPEDGGSCTPAAVPGLSGVVAISAGSSHNLALLGTGTVVAWGDNTYGQLGIGNCTGPNTCGGPSPCSFSPVAVSGLSGVTAISAGGAHSLALLSDGTVVGWGSNNQGQIGSGTNPDTCGGLPARTTATAVSGVSDVTAISAGGEFSLAVLGNHTIQSWGDNFTGQLGNGTTTDSAAPTAVKGLHHVTAIATGYQHALAISTYTTSKCAGDKFKAVGKKAGAKATCHARAVAKGLSPVDSTCLAKAEVKFSTAFAKAEAKALGCFSAGDATTLEGDVDTFIDDLATQLGGPGPNTCTSTKYKAAGKKTQAKLDCHAKAVSKGVPLNVGCIAKAEVKFSVAFAKADAKVSPACLSTGDASTVEGMVDGFVDDVENAIAP